MSKPANYNSERENMHAAACVWEDMLERRTIASRGVLASSPSAKALAKVWEYFGSTHMRYLACDLGKHIEACYYRVPEEDRELLGAFDWEFVPRLLDKVDWETPATFLRKSEEEIYQEYLVPEIHARALVADGHISGSPSA